MDNPTPRFTGIFIPVEILENQELTLLEQMLLAWIDALYCKEHKGCYAKNEYFAKKLKVRENTIAKALTSLRQKGLLIDISFDGRNRVIRAQIGGYVEKAQSNAGLDLNPMQGWTEIQCRVGEKSNPTYIYSKEENKEDNTPPIPPQISKEEAAKPQAAKAADEGVDNSSKEKSKRTRTPTEFSPKVREVTSAMIEIIQKYHPVYRLPDNLEKFMEAVKLMIEKDKQDSELLLKTFEWACSDCEQRDNFKGWQSVVCTNKRKGKVSNPAEIFRGHFSTIYSQMRAQPKRKFAPSSDDAKSLEQMIEWSKGAL